MLRHVPNTQGDGLVVLHRDDAAIDRAPLWKGGNSKHTPMAADRGVPLFALCGTLVLLRDCYLQAVSYHGNWFLLLRAAELVSEMSVNSLTEFSINDVGNW